MAKATRVLAGVAVAALATAGVAAVVRYRQRQQLEPDEHAQLDELEARLSEVGDGAPASGVGRVFENLQRNQGISVNQLRGWIAGLRGETLSPEQAVVAESDFEALEREADQGGA
jgi:hypothetical protein